MSVLSDKLFEYYTQKQLEPTKGWDFSYIRNRMIMEPLPWSYESLAIRYLVGSESVIDLETGTGELLARLPLPDTAYATENQEDNIKLVKQNLEKRDVTILNQPGDAKLDLPDESIDVVLCRHGKYNAEEIKRILTPGGIFLTQQVGATDTHEIHNWFETGQETDITWNIQDETKKFEDLGFELVTRGEAFPCHRIYDIGALIYFLKSVPWIISDFSVEKYEEKLHNLHKTIERQGYWEITGHRFLMIFKKEEDVPEFL